MEAVLIEPKLTDQKDKLETLETNLAKSNKELEILKMNYPEDLQSKFSEKWSRKFLFTKAQSAQQALKNRKTMSLKYYNIRAKFITSKNQF